VIRANPELQQSMFGRTYLLTGKHTRLKPVTFKQQIQYEQELGTQRARTPDKVDPDHFQYLTATSLS